MKSRYKFLVGFDYEWQWQYSTRWTRDRILLQALLAVEIYWLVNVPQQVFLNLQSIDYTYQETYTAIKRNPNPANTAYPFYALGQAEFSADKPILSF